MAASAALPSHDVAALICRFVAASKSFSNVECQRLFGLVESLKAAQRECIIELVEAASHRPLCIESCSDTTPGLVKRHITSQPRQLGSQGQQSSRGFSGAICSGIFL